VRFRQRTTEHGKVLGEGEDGAAVHRAPAGDDAVAGDVRLLHAEIGGAVLDEHVELLERVAVHQELDPLARRELAALVLGVDARLATAGAGACAALFEPVDDVCHYQTPGIRDQKSGTRFPNARYLTADIARPAPSVTGGAILA